jgi:hypothetical protein
MRSPIRRLSIRFLIALLAATGAYAADEATGKTAHVTYVSGSTVYVDAGSDDGLAVGDVVELIRDQAVAARLKVTFVSSHRSSCEPLTEGFETKTGDAVRYAPHASATASSAPGATGSTGSAAPGTPAPARRASKESAFRRAGLRGRIGARYLWISDRSGFGVDLAQPALDLLLRGAQIGGAPVDLDIDVRSRRTYRTPTGGSRTNESLDRIYSANFSYRPGPMILTLGRQQSPTLAVVSLFDGLTAAYAGPRWQAGILAGVQPDPDSYSFSSDVRQEGVYARRSNDPASSTRWNFGFGMISSTQNGEINRDFVYVEARVTTRALGVYAQQQVDVNRGWRKDAEGSSFTPSGSFLMIHARPGAAWSLDVGYDSRRNVRVYRDYISPVTEFDDATRQGAWLGLSWRPKGHWLLGADGRRSQGGTAGTATAYTLRFGATNLTSHSVDVVLRGTKYDGPTLAGWLADVTASADLGPKVRAQVHGGSRHNDDLTFFGSQSTINWYGVGLDVLACRSVYFNISYDRTAGGNEDNDQAYAAISWRF